MTRTLVRVENEIRDSGLAREILGASSSWSDIIRVEEELRSRRNKLQKEVLPLEYSLKYLDLSEQKRREISERIESLSRSHVFEFVWLRLSVATSGFGQFVLDENALTKNTDEKDRWKNTHSQHQREFEECSLERSFTNNVTRDWVFVAEETENSIQWRAVQYEILKKPNRENNAPSTTSSQRLIDQCPRGIDEDSLSHFQNCPLPPDLVAPDAKTSTQIESHNLLMGGCSVSINLNIFEQTSQNGGIEWKKSKKRWKKVSESYARLQMKYLGNLKNSFTFYQTLRKITQIFPRRYCQLFSKCKVVSQKAIMMKHSGCSSFYSFLLEFNEKRNRDVHKGELN
jgi:hypothetical protein